MRLLVLHEARSAASFATANSDRLRRMSDRSVSILTLGGTIAMTSQAPGGPVQPALDADDLTVALGRYLPGRDSQPDAGHGLAATADLHGAKPWTPRGRLSRPGPRGGGDAGH